MGRKGMGRRRGKGGVDKENRLTDRVYRLREGKTCKDRNSKKRRLEGIERKPQ